MADKWARKHQREKRLRKLSHLKKTGKSSSIRGGVPQHRSSHSVMVDDIQERRTTFAEVGGHVSRRMLNPDSLPLAAWRAFHELTLLAFVAIVPLLLAFESEMGAAAVAQWQGWAPLLGAVLWLDIALYFLSAVRWRGLLVRSLRFSAARYARSGWLVVDLLTALPLPGHSVNKVLTYQCCLLLRFFDLTYSRLTPLVVPLPLLYSG